VIKELKLPIDVSELEPFLPHRGPMVWVHQIRQVDSRGGEALIYLDSKAHCMDREKLRPSSVIEWIAQTYGFVSACQRLQSWDGSSTVKISHAYLASFKNLLFLEKFDPSVHAEKSLVVAVQTLRDLKPFMTFYGEVKTLTGKKIATGEITVYSD
jgi:predicted hotdog family 3-hydroxylacyl-ACP dehydratase